MKTAQLVARFAGALLACMLSATVSAESVSAQSASAQSADSTTRPGPVYRVSGVVFDSLANEPLANAFVAVRPGGLTTTTDSTGRFLITASEPATEITAYHPALDEIGLGALSLARDAGVGDWTNVRLATPSLETVWPVLCDSRRPERLRSAVVLGTARLADNRTRVAGARVLVQWAPALPEGGTAALRTLEVTTDSIGNFIACGLEEYAEPALLAISREAQSGVIRLPASVRSVRRVDLVLAPLGEGRQLTSLRGRVTTTEGRPLPDMRVDIEGRDGVVSTNASGIFRLDSVPLGSRMLTVRAVGYTPVAQVVEVLEGDNPEVSIPVSAAIELDEVRVTEKLAVSRTRQDFELRRQAGLARFVDSTEFAKNPFMCTSMQMVPNVRVYQTRGTECVITGRNNCLAHIYLDGTLSNIDEVNRIPTQNIAAVEFYRSVSQAPAAFIRVMADDCAVVIFWTKYGLRP